MAISFPQISIFLSQNSEVVLSLEWISTPFTICSKPTYPNSREEIAWTLVSGRDPEKWGLPDTFSSKAGGKPWWGESLTINSEEENLGKFSSSSEASSSPVLPTVLSGQVLNPQGRHIGHMDPVLVLVLEADPGWGICPMADLQQDSVVWLRAKAPWDLFWVSFLILGQMKQHRTSLDPLQGNMGSRILNSRTVCSRTLDPSAADT